MSIESLLQGNLDITKGQGTGKICSLYRGDVTSGSFPYVTFTITGAKNIVRYTQPFII